jgi:hypothetical protein
LEASNGVYDTCRLEKTLHRECGILLGDPGILSIDSRADHFDEGKIRNVREASDSA